MAAVKSSDVDRVLRHPPSTARAFLFYGPDQGQVAELARRLADPDGSKPLDLVRLSGDDIADDPGRLVDELASLGLFGGGRRTVLVRASSRNIVPAVSAALDRQLNDALLVIEAGDLARSSPLRQLCEKSPCALALPCYGDTGRGLEAVVADTLQEAGMILDPDARELLVESLGGDRLATRSELEKLVTYAGPGGRIGLEEVRAVISDVAPGGRDAVIDAAFDGDAALVVSEVATALGRGESAGGLLAASLRYGLGLLAARAGMEEDGIEARMAVERWRGLHWKQRQAATRHLTRQAVDDLTRIVGSVEAAILESRRSPALGPAIVAQTLLSVARRAARPPRVLGAGN